MKLLKNKYLWILLSIIAPIIMVFTLMPKPIDMDLEKIGDGQKSVVFVYDPNLAVSNQQAIEINKAIKIIGEQVNFLIVKIGDPESESFKNKYRARSADLLFFNGDGELFDRQVALLNAELLVEKLLER
jgi:hypothetical protein